MTGLALWSLAKRLWPIAAAALVVLAVILWGNSRFDAGVAAERLEWQAEAARLRAIAATEAAQRAAAVTAANDAATRSQASLDALAAQSRNDHATYYRDRPAVRCLSDDRLRAIKDADRAASAAASAK